MSVKNIKTPLLILFSSVLVNCQHVVIPNTEACAVAGRLEYGADCSETRNKNNRRELSFLELVEFLEARPATPLRPAKGAAICQSTEDYIKIKTTLETACEYLGKRCTYEMREDIKNFGNVIDNLKGIP